MAIVTISRGSMSGGRTLAECLSKALCAPCIGREIVVEAAARLGVSKRLLQDKIEKSPGFFERFSTERHTYVLAVQASLAAHTATGRLVYHGQAGHLLLRGLPAVLRVRLIAPFESRVRAVVEEKHMSADQAADHIRQLDGDRARWTRAMYGVDVADPALYDLVVNLETISIHSACEAIQGILRQPEYQIDDEVLDKLRKFASSCRAQLEAHPALKGAAAAQGAPRVLVIDSEPDAAAVLASRLRDRKYAPVVASSTQEALLRAGAEAFDAVLLDLEMGLGLLREIRALDDEVQVVVVAGRGTVASAIEGMQIGAADFLRKPVEFEALCTAVDAAVETTRSNRSQGG